MKSITLRCSTPWGQADFVTHTDVDTGEQVGTQSDRTITHVATPSHGGIYVPPSLLKEMKQTKPNNRYCGSNWFEEDCEWAYVARAFPKAFKPEHVTDAEKTIKWHEDFIARHEKQGAPY